MNEQDNLQTMKKSFIRHWWWVFIVLLIIILVLVFVLKIFRHGGEDNNSQNSSDLSQEDDGQILSHGACTGEQKTKLSALPMDESDFSMILPYGMVVGSHVTPIDHQYFAPASMQSARDAYPVYAMADANLVTAEPRIKPEGTEYRLVFSVSCKLFYYYDLVTSLEPNIMSEVEKSKNSQGLNLPVKAGELIGHIGGQTLDFAVWDMDSRLSGFVVPEHYKGELWKIHTVDPLDYYSDDLKQKALAKYIRTTDPRSGKIDYDIDGKLIGNWFLEGTGGYGNGSQMDYWKNHLSIAPDYIDPTSIVVSMGDYGGKEQQLGVKGNVPDPATVSVDNGLIKYELVQKDWADSSGHQWNRTSFVQGLKASNGSNIEGVVLLQLTEDRKLKFEAFPGKTADQVSGFDANVKIYER